MSRNDVRSIGIEKYVLASSFSRSNLQNGDLCLYIRSYVCFNRLDFSNYCKEKILEMCIIQIETTDKRIIVICVYRSPSGDFNHFLSLLRYGPLLCEEAIHGDTHLWRLQC